MMFRQDIKNGLGKSKSPEQIHLSRKEYMEFEKTFSTAAFAKQFAATNLRSRRRREVVFSDN
jgi:hypothetical protein